LHASFESDIELLALEMAKTLKLSPQTQLSITTIDRDKAYMLSMAPIFTSLVSYLQPYVSDIKIHSFRGEENAIIREIVRTSGPNYRPVRLYEPQVDSLIMLGSYYMMENTADSVNFSVTVMDLCGRKLFQSAEYTVTRKEAPVSLKREVFARLSDNAQVSEMLYRGRVIQKLETLFNSPNNNLLSYPALYRFEHNHPYAIQWQVHALREVLTIAYGVSFDANSRNSITLEPTGTISFKHENTIRPVDDMVDGEPLFPPALLDGFDSLVYLYTDPRAPGRAAHVEKKAFDTPGEKTVQERITETFTVYYPSLFSPLKPAMIDRVFADKDHPSILVGSVVSVDPSTGREIVKYGWHSKKAWLAGLMRAQEQKERFFEVSADVLAVFCDNLNPSRYWAIVLQQWQTKDRYHKIVYQDDGFLIVNFDFAADRTLREFKVHYRLWFYNYRYDDIELGLLRHEKLVQDIQQYFIEGIGGIDASLKQAMLDCLVNTIHTIGDTCRVQKSITPPRAEKETVLK